MLVKAPRGILCTCTYMYPFPPCACAQGKTNSPNPFMASLSVLASVSALKLAWAFTVPSVAGSYRWMWKIHKIILMCIIINTMYSAGTGAPTAVYTQCLYVQSWIVVDQTKLQSCYGIHVCVRESYSNPEFQRVS